MAKLLEKHGWQCARVRGSHRVYTKPGNSVQISMPIHGDMPLRPGLQRHLLRAAGIADDVS